MKRTREDDTDVRKLQIVETAVALSLKIGYKMITKKEIARSMGVSPSLITHYFKVVNLQDEVLKYAIKNNLHAIVAQGICLNDKQVKRLSKDQKRTILKSIGA